MCTRLVVDSFYRSSIHLPYSSNKIFKDWLIISSILECEQDSARGARWYTGNIIPVKLFDFHRFNRYCYYLIKTLYRLSRSINLAHSLRSPYNYPRAFHAEERWRVRGLLAHLPCTRARWFFRWRSKAPSLPSHGHRLSQILSSSRPPRRLASSRVSSSTRTSESETHTIFS